MNKPLLLDLFCGAGGAARGYQRAGFYVIGVDINPQPNYCGDEFIQGDALEVLVAVLENGGCLPDGRAIAVIHASPPCQRHSDLQRRTGREYPELIQPTRELLVETDLPYAIENVEGAPLIDPAVLCGVGFSGLRVIRHRLFETNFPLKSYGCPGVRNHPPVFTHDKRKAHYGKLDQNTSYVQVTGGGNCTVANKKASMGIEWMTGAEVNEAIPPAYTEYVGLALMEHLGG